MLHRKPHIENHRRSAEKRLATRIERLTANGVDVGRMNKDTQIKRFKAQVRKAKRELTAIAAMEALMVDKTESRIRKEAVAQAEKLQKRSKKRDPNAPPAKKRKKSRGNVDEDVHKDDG